MNGKKCPNCGACQECGHVPTTPYYGPYYTYPYWSVVPPTWTQPVTYPTLHPTTGGNVSATFTVTNTTAALQ